MVSLHLYSTDTPPPAPTTSIQVPRNTPPTVLVIRPNGGEKIIGLYEIRWSANDADGDNLTFIIYYSPNNGYSWTQLATGVTGTTYTWDTSNIVDGSIYLIKIAANDGLSSSEDISDAVFIVGKGSPVESSVGGRYIPSFLTFEAVGAIIILATLRMWKKRKSADQD